MIPKLETERLILRGPEARDLDAYAAFYADAEASAFYGGPLRRDQAWRKLAEAVGHWSLRGFGVWTIETRDGGALLGGCGLWHPEGWPRRELTWWLLPEARGSGYATEASLAAIAFGFDTLGWETVETHMRDENTAARRLTERLGGEKIGRETFPDGAARDVFRFPAPSNERSAA